jgi:glycosyltransferase involved in cell wall biosynthesis
MARVSSNERNRSGVKLAIVIGSLGRGGSERQIVEFVRSAHPDHAECFVICLGEEGQLASEVRDVGAPVFALGFVGVRSWSSAAVLWRLYRLLRREQPDAVYGFLFWGYSLALPVARLAIPAATRVAARRSFPDYDVPRHRVLSRLRRPADAVSDAIIANSAEVAAAWLRVNPRLRGRMHVVPNGVRTAGQSARRTDRRPAVIACVANLIAYKGHATLLAALELLPKEVAWSLELAGDGPERQNILKQIRDRGLERRVRVLGLVEDMEPVFRDADIAVLASYTEGLPNAVLEAMAHGVPVVATDVGGVRDLLEGGAGIVVPPYDVAALASAIARMLADRDLRVSAGQIGAWEAEMRFGIPSMRDGTLSVIHSARREGR